MPISHADSYCVRSMNEKNCCQQRAVSDCCRNMLGHFLCGVERVERFMDVHLHCIGSNVGKVEMATPRLEKFLRTRILGEAIALGPSSEFRTSFCIVLLISL